MNYKICIHSTLSFLISNNILIFIDYNEFGRLNIATVSVRPIYIVGK